MRVLIVDDDEAFVELLKFQLSQMAAIDTVIAQTGEQALDILGIAPPFGEVGTVDLVLVDLDMPGMGGIKAIERVKRDPRYRDLPMVVVTSRGELEDLLAAYDAGAVDYIRKPIDTVEGFSHLRAAIAFTEETRRRHRLEHALADAEQQINVLRARLGEALEQLAAPHAGGGYAAVAAEPEEAPIAGEALTTESIESTLAPLFARAAKHDVPVSLLAILIDGWGNIHAKVGAPAAVRLVKRIHAELGDVISRVGVDILDAGEGGFVVGIPDASEKQAVAWAQHVRDAIIQIGRSGFEGHRFRVSCSIGVASTEHHGATAKEVLSSALQAQQDAGGNRVLLATPGLVA